ncbi:hypothetical protein A8F94_10510 [Bacillus sp. FJAT-27225]|uniref:hypothetical protein n=1 Tax=Bacillus sp. FJAT-27225 TaxID=1743144 RepID=UPI00080C26BE|nr:hypothetical protein [Bacillus sp. FJAT-27225]OCA88225.1 hypothetical protein A8F94_10510 [Bacillus sp. FJAT-27225]
MCVPNDSIELGIQTIVRQMIQDSAYRITGLEINGGRVVSTAVVKPTDLITSVLLVDKAGISYSVKPGFPGIRFTRGEITYDEYVRLQKRANQLSFCLFGAAVIILFAAGILLLKLYL